MKIECPKCGFSGKIDPARLPENGANLKCKQCDERFFVAKPAASPQPAPAAQPGLGAAAAVGPLANCNVCGSPHAEAEMIQFGDKWVCAGCKPTYVQMLQQGEAGAIDMEYAGFWIRAVAKIIDSIVLAIILWPISMLIMSMITFNPQSPDPMADMMPIMGLNYLFQIGIPAAFTTFFLGRFMATPGKMALGLIVVSPEREKISYPRALGRHFAEWISGMILGIGYLMVAFDSEKRSLHDRICNTRVVRK